MKKVVLVDDHSIFRDGLKSLLTNEGIAEVVDEAANGQEFLDCIDNLKPDIVLMDIEMPVINGIEATRLAVQKYPDLKVLVLSMYGEEQYYYEMIQAGAKGFILKSSGAEELINAINQVVSGASYFSNELLQKIISSFGHYTTKASGEIVSNALTIREIEVLQALCQGLSNSEIAELLHISPKTVKGHRSSLLSKTGSKNTASLIIFAIKHKVIEIV